MATQWHKTEFKGVRYRKHETRKHGIKFDRYFTVTYKLDGKTITEAAGWASEGIKPSEVYNDLLEIKRNRKRGEGPVTLTEKRSIQKKKRQKESNANVTLDQYWPQYLALRRQDKKFKSWNKEESHYIHWLSPVLGKTSLKDIDTDSFDKLVVALSEKSERTKQYVTGTLRRLLKHAKIRGIINSDPPSPKDIGVTGPGSTNRRRRVINQNEARDILNGIKKENKHAWRITRFAFLTGCRASEAFSLKWRDIDEIRGILTFPETKNKDKRELSLSEPLKKLFSEIPHGELNDHVF